MTADELFSRHGDDETCLTWGEVRRYHELKEKAAGSDPGMHEIFPSRPTALVDAMNNGYLPRKTRMYRQYLVMGPGTPFGGATDWFRSDAEVDEYYALDAYMQFAAANSLLALKRVRELEDTAI